jgi:hypothetical protein
VSLPVDAGLVYQVEFEFPPGCSGLAHVAVFDGALQVWPINMGQFFASDAYVISFSETYMKKTKPHEFVIMGFNEDETYEHTIQIRIGLVSKNEYISRFLPAYNLPEMKVMLQEIIKENKPKEVMKPKGMFGFLK